MIRKAILGAFFLMAVMFSATENSFAQARPVPGQMGGSLLGVGVGGNTQSNNLYYHNGGAYYGRVTVYPGSHYQIETNGTVIKTFAKSCRKAPSSGGAEGYLCSFGQWNRQGTQIYSGWGYFYTSGYVYLKWAYENNGGQWRQINTDWYTFIPR